MPEMTPEQAREWFRIYGESKFETYSPVYEGRFTVEQQYAAFYARMLQDFKQDATCNCLVNVPKEKS